MLRQASVMCDDATEAWLSLLSYGQCYMRLYGSNLTDLRGLWEQWADEQAKEAEE